MAPASLGSPPQAGASHTDHSVALVGYFCAVNAATISAMILEARIVVRDLDLPLVGFVLTLFLHGSFFWFVTLFTSALPAAAAYAIAHWRRIHSIVYYIACGAIIGAMLTPLAILPDPRRPFAPPPFLESYLRAVPIIMAIGAVAGSIFWYKVRRHLFVTRTVTSTTRYDAILRRVGLGIVWALCLAIPAYVVAPLIELLWSSN